MTINLGQPETPPINFLMLIVPNQRKGSAARPWVDNGRSLSDAEGGWETIAPSPMAFGAELSRADIVLLAREMLRNPYWPLEAAADVHQKKAIAPPVQYARAS